MPIFKRKEISKNIKRKFREQNNWDVMTFRVLRDVPMQRIRIRITLVRLPCVQFALLYVYQLRGETTRYYNSTSPLRTWIAIAVTSYRDLCRRCASLSIPDTHNVIDVVVDDINSWECFVRECREFLIFHRKSGDMFFPLYKEIISSRVSKIYILI